MLKTIRPCPICGKHIPNHHAKICKKCYIKKHKVEKINITCLTCGKIFKDYKSYYYKYCSLECAYLYRSIPTYRKFKQYLRTIDKSFLNWFAGFWEGEGCIVKRYNNRSYSISVSQNDKPILLLIKKTFKCGRVSGSRLRTGNMHYHYIISNLGETLALAESLLPFVKIRKRKNELKRVIAFKKSKQVRFYA